MKTTDTKKASFIQSIIILMLFFTVSVLPASGQQQGSQLLFTDNFQGIQSFHDIPVSIKVEKASLDEIFSQLEKQMSLRFIYNPIVIGKSDHLLDLDLSDASVADVLREVAIQTGLSFRQVNGTISIGVNKLRTPETEILEEVIQQTITGSVIDSQTGEALPGVNVIVESAEEATGSVIGTVTDNDGVYEIQVPDEFNTLVYTYVGYQRMEVNIDGRSEINVELVSDVQMIDDLVVIGYGIQRREDLTGSISSVNADEIMDQPSTSLDNALQGKLAGVRVVQGNGAPGSTPRVRIRGQNSVLGGSDPLYVIDGVPLISGQQGVTNELASINPGDIESIDVLKDASATSIYGARGSNGVILITTKKGIVGQQRVNFETSLSISKVENKLDLMNSEQFVEIANERARNDDIPEPFPNPSAVTGTNTNWMDEIFRTGYRQNYSLSTSGGDETTRFAISTNFTNEDGTIISSNFKRGSFRVNLEQDVTPKLRITPSIYVSRVESDRILTEGSGQSIVLNAFAAPPILTPFNEEGNVTSGAVLRQFPFSPADMENPVGLALERTDKLSSNRVLGNVSARYELMDGLSLKIMGGVDNTDNEIDIYNTRLIGFGLPAGSGFESRNSTTNFLNENTLNYVQSFGSDHQISATAGYTWQQQKSQFLSGSASNFVTDDLLNNNLSAGENFGSPNNGQSEWTLISWLGRLNYTFKNRYLFTVTGRIDGSSRFGTGNKYAKFPSGAFAWRVSEESFMKEVDQIDNLKLRVSWGLTGNQAINPYQSLQRLVPRPVAFGQNESVGFAPANLANPNLKWETTEQIDTGIDLEAWDQRIRMSADYYYKNTSDLLALVNLPPNTGFGSILQNIGSVVNKGVEFQLGADILRGEFGWNINANISTNKNEVKELARGADVIPPQINVLGSVNIIREGEPLGSFFGLEQDGLTEDGLFNYVDQNDDGEINSDDRVILGSPYPDFVYGLSMNFDYKGFSMNTLIQGEAGKEVYNSNRERTGVSMYRGSNPVAAAVNRWRPDNPDPNAPFPKATSNLNLAPSSFFVEDASFIRLKNVRLAYDIPVLNLNLPLRTATIYVSGQNLITITDYSYFNPDVNSYSSNDLRIGVDFGSYPNNRSVTFGLNVGF